MLRVFVRKVGTVLGNITSLSLLLEDTGGSAAAAVALNIDLMPLADACPALTSCHLSSPLPSGFLCSLGQQCPLLCALTINLPDPL